MQVAMLLDVDIWCSHALLQLAHKKSLQEACQRSQEGKLLGFLLGSQRPMKEMSVFRVLNGPKRPNS